MKESKTLEFKEDITSTFLKTVSAFANFDGGRIIFGIADDGTLKGLRGDLDETCLSLENKINDSITPKPEFALKRNAENRTIELIVEPGDEKPYFYKGKAYRRSDTATVEVSRLELNRLTLSGMNLHFDSLPSKVQNLSFKYFLKEVEKTPGLASVGNKALSIFELYAKKGEYNNAAALIADKNQFPGIDIARFGESVNTILERKQFKNISVLEQFDSAMEIFKRNYQYEEISGSRRVQKERIPEKAFREALANALVHRTWDIDSDIRISMHQDRIEISSPGGLPNGLDAEEFMKGRISSFRNPKLGFIFIRLKICEGFATGIQRIKDGYRKTEAEPQFSVTDNSVLVVLPELKRQSTRRSTAVPYLTLEEKKILDLLDPTIMLSTNELCDHTGYDKQKVLKILKSLRDKQLVLSIGRTRSVRYVKAPE